MPFTFADILILRYLLGTVDENQTVKDFGCITISSDLKWSFKSQVIKFIKRFFKAPYRDEDTKWIKKLASNTYYNFLCENTRHGIIVVSYKKRRGYNYG